MLMLRLRLPIPAICCGMICAFEKGKDYAAEYGRAGEYARNGSRQKSLPMLLSLLCFHCALSLFSPSVTRPLGFPPRNKKEPDVQVQTPIPNLVHYLGDQDLAFLLRPAEHFADETEGVRLDAHGHVFALVAADFFHLGVFRPGADWDLETYKYGRAK